MFISYLDINKKLLTTIPKSLFEKEKRLEQKPNVSLKGFKIFSKLFENNEK